MDLYSKYKEDEEDRRKRLQRSKGGAPSDLYPFSRIMNKAKQLSSKYVFNKLDKKNILDAGTRVIDNVLSGTATRKAISIGARKLRRKLGKYKKMRLKKRLLAKGGGGMRRRRRRRRRSMKGGSGGRYKLNPFYKLAIRQAGKRVIRRKRRNNQPTRLAGSTAAQRKVAFYRLGVKALEQQRRINRSARRRRSRKRRKGAPKRGARRVKRRRAPKSRVSKRRRRRRRSKTPKNPFNLQNFVKRRSRRTKKGGALPSSASSIKNTIFDQ